MPFFAALVVDGDWVSPDEDFWDAVSTQKRGDRVVETITGQQRVHLPGCRRHAAEAQHAQQTAKAPRDQTVAAVGFALHQRVTPETDRHFGTVWLAVDWRAVFAGVVNGARSTAG